MGADPQDVSGPRVESSVEPGTTFGSYHYVSGTDTHAGHALSTSVSWPFER